MTFQIKALFNIQSSQLDCLSNNKIIKVVYYITYPSGTAKLPLEFLVNTLFITFYKKVRSPPYCCAVPPAYIYTNFHLTNLFAL